MASDKSWRMLRLILGGQHSLRKLRLFAIACCREVWDRIPTPEAKRLVEVLELYLEKQARWREVLEQRKAADRAYGSHYNDWVAGRGADAPYAWAAHQAAGQTPDQIAHAAHCTMGLPYGRHLSRSGPDPAQADLLRDIFGNPLHPVAFNPSWRTITAVGLAQAMYDSRDFGPAPILADALEDAGCDQPDILAHCRGPGPHVRGCWVVDLVLGKS